MSDPLIGLTWFLGSCVVFQWVLVTIFFFGDFHDDGFKTKKQFLLWLIPLGMPIFYLVTRVFCFVPREALRQWRNLK